MAVLEGSGRLVGPKAFRREYNKLGNFLKHADKDPDNAITGIGEETNEALLLTCCALLKEIEGLSSAEWRALWLWYHGIHFENPAEAPDLFWEWAEEFLKELHASERDRLIEIGAILLKRLEATKSI